MELKSINKPLFGNYTTHINTPAEIALVTAIALSVLAIYPNRHSKTALLSITATCAASTIALLSISSYKANDRINRLLEKLEKIYNSVTTTLSKTATTISTTASKTAQNVSNYFNKPKEEA